MEFDECGYYEPSQADIILDEFTGKMREALTETAKNEIERLRRENAELKDANKKLRQEAVAVNMRSQELERKEKNLECRFYEKKFSEILEPLMNNITVYMASHEGHSQAKCSYCDDEGKLTFKAPDGQETRQYCKCRSYIYWYEPIVCELREISLFKYRRCDNKKFIATGKFERDSGDDERFFKSETRMVLEVFSQEVVEQIKTDYNHRIVFTSKAECQKYCDWLNAEREKNEKH
jgi:FtsZ-binding cell division protein ZapB